MPEQGMDKKRCFIITPIGNDNDSIRRHIDGIIDAAIKPALEPDYEVVAAHKITETGTITKQILIAFGKNLSLIICSGSGAEINLSLSDSFFPSSTTSGSRDSNMTRHWYRYSLSESSTSI